VDKMKKKVYKLIALVCFFLLIVSIGFAGKDKNTVSNKTQLLSPSRAGEQIERKVLSAGATRGSGTGFCLSGTAFQTAVGTGEAAQAVAKGGRLATYTLVSGFWHGLKPDCAAPSYLCGDVNDDGAINLADPICLANYYFGKPCSIVPEASDVDCSSVANLGDAIIIANVYFGKPGFELNCCS